MKDQGIKIWLPWVLAAMALVAGCGGVLLESVNRDGQVERVKLDAGPKWRSYDQRPRHPHVDAQTYGSGDMSIILKSEKSF